MAWQPPSLTPTLMTKFSEIFANSTASATIALQSVRWGLTSTLTGLSVPATKAAISSNVLRKGFPAFATCLGFVVTPSMSQTSSAYLISSVLALSRNNFITVSSGRLRKPFSVISARLGTCAYQSVPPSWKPSRTKDILADDDVDGHLCSRVRAVAYLYALAVTGLGHICVDKPCAVAPPLGCGRFEYGGFSPFLDFPFLDRRRAVANPFPGLFSNQGDHQDCAT